MNQALLLPLMAVLIIACVVVLVSVTRSVWREMTGLGDEHEEAQARRMEERKNERIRREIQQRRGEWK